MNSNQIYRRLKRFYKRAIRTIQSNQKRLRNIHKTELGKLLLVAIGFAVICIVAAQLAPGSAFRKWYAEKMHKEVINKGVQYETQTQETQYGTFLTHYRFQAFGATNPEEVDPSAPMVALTFDDGPNPDYTQRILAVLCDNYSRATFFVVGTNAEKYPEMLKAISDSGSEIGNHTFNHKNLTELSEEDAIAQIEQVNRAVNKATGEDTTVIRPPYGATNDEVLALLQEPVVLWDMDTEDWESRNAQTIADKVLSVVKDGDIILMHDIYDSTAEAVEILVPKLKEQGYQIVTVSEMARLKGKELELHKAYGKIQNESE